MGKKTVNNNNYFTLFVKFSRRVPNPLNIQDEVRAMYSNVLNVRKPRQKSARWILVDFETEQQAQEFKKILEEKKRISTLPVKYKDLNIKQHSQTKEENERQDKINSLARQTFQSSKLEKYSNKLLVTNLPKTITLEDLKELFPGHIKIDLKHSPTTKAYVTYSSAKEAFSSRMSLSPVVAKEKYRVILLLLNNEKSKKPKSNTIESNSTSGRYFESSIE